MGGREHRCFHCTTGRQQQAGGSANRPFNNTVFWPCGAPASHLHHSVCSTLLCLKQRCRCTVYISESKKKKKKNTRINYVCFGEGGGSTWCHQRRNFHLNRCVMRGWFWCIHKRNKKFLVNKVTKIAAIYSLLGPCANILAWKWWINILTQINYRPLSCVICVTADPKTSINCF